MITVTPHPMTKFQTFKLLYWPLLVVTLNKFLHVAIEKQKQKNKVGICLYPNNNFERLESSFDFCILYKEDYVELKNSLVC